MKIQLCIDKASIIRQKKQTRFFLLDGILKKGKRNPFFEFYFSPKKYAFVPFCLETSMVLFWIVFLRQIYQINKRKTVNFYFIYCRHNIIEPLLDIINTQSPRSIITYSTSLDKIIPLVTSIILTPDQVISSKVRRS